MKVAANVVAVLAWGSFLAAFWFGLLTDARPPFSVFFAIVFFSFLVGVFVPAYLIYLGAREAPGGNNDRAG